MQFEQRKPQRRTKAGRLVSTITYDELSQYFHLPSEKACKELGVGLTILKRVCRKLGIPRWPYNRIPKSQHQDDSATDSEGSFGGSRGSGGADTLSCRNPSTQPSPARFASYTHAASSSLTQQRLPQRCSTTAALSSTQHLPLPYFDHTQQRQQHLQLRHPQQPQQQLPLLPTAPLPVIPVLHQPHPYPLHGLGCLAPEWPVRQRDSLDIAPFTASGYGLPACAPHISPEWATALRGWTDNRNAPRSLHAPEDELGPRLVGDSALPAVQQGRWGASGADFQGTAPPTLTPPDHHLPRHGLPAPRSHHTPGLGSGRAGSGSSPSTNTSFLPLPQRLQGLPQSLQPVGKGDQPRLWEWQGWDEAPLHAASPLRPAPLGSVFLAQQAPPHAFRPWSQHAQHDAQRGMSPHPAPSKPIMEEVVATLAKVQALLRQQGVGPEADAPRPASPAALGSMFSGGGQQAQGGGSGQQAAGSPGGEGMQAPLRPKPISLVGMMQRGAEPAAEHDAQAEPGEVVAPGLGVKAEQDLPAERGLEGGAWMGRAEQGGGGRLAEAPFDAPAQQHEALCMLAKHAASLAGLAQLAAME